MTFRDFIYLSIIFILCFLLVGEQWRLEKKYGAFYEKLYSVKYAEKKAELINIVLELHREAWAKEK